MPLYSLPYIPSDLESQFLGDAYHLLYEECLTEDNLNPQTIDFILRSPMHNYVTLRCNTLNITALLCVCRSWTRCNGKEFRELRIMQVEIDSDYQGIKNFVKFIDIMTTISKTNKRVLTLMNVSSERMQEIMAKNSDIYQPMDAYEGSYIVTPSLVL